MEDENVGSKANLELGIFRTELALLVNIYYTMRIPQHYLMSA